MPFYIKPESLDWALKHIENYGDTDIFPLPFEFEAIRLSWDSKIRNYLSEQDILQYRTRPYRRCLSPKHRFGFRISTQLDPFDMLIYTALVYDIGYDIESYRVPVSNQIVHSYRFNPDTDGRFFDTDVGYDSFIQQSKYFAFSGKFQKVVIADIADFFPRIYHHPLGNALDVCTRLFLTWAFDIGNWTLDIPLSSVLCLL